MSSYSEKYIEDQRQFCRDLDTRVQRRPLRNWHAWEFFDMLNTIKSRLDSAPQYLRDRALPYARWMGKFLIEGKKRDKENEFISHEGMLDMLKQLHDNDLKNAQLIWELGTLLKSHPDTDLGEQSDIADRAVVFVNRWSSFDEFLDAQPRVMWLKFLDTRNRQLLAQHIEWSSTFYGNDGANNMIDNLFAGMNEVTSPHEDAAQLNASYKKIVDQCTQIILTGTPGTDKSYYKGPC